MDQNGLHTTIAPNLSILHALHDNETITEDDGDWSPETLEHTRYIIQRIIVPCVVTIGIAGNLLTVVVLTRRRMRCSTNIYLTALAIADIVNLFFAFILSLQRYPNFSYGHSIYWSTIGLSHWFHDASLYTSIYLIVSFTLERYISVCHPLRGQVLCTESRAKKVITAAAVVILCFLCTITTRFEYELKSSETHFDYSLGRLCAAEEVNSNTHANTCKLTHMYYVVPSIFSQSDSYQNFFYYPSTIFGTLLPFVMLSILNAFLIWTVRKQHKMRHRMTNRRQTDSSQETKVTITLIAVVILFLICQTPNALQLLRIMDLKHHRNRDLVLNNIFNLLVSINAASNFILYCALSDKYRKTVKVLFCGGRPMRRNTMSYTSPRTTSSFYNRSNTSNLFSIPIYRKRGPRFSISKEEYENLQAETAKRKRFSSITQNNSVIDSEQTEEIQMSSSKVFPTKSEKSRIKSIRFSFTPPNMSLRNKSKSDQTSVDATQTALEVKPTEPDKRKSSTTNGELSLPSTATDQAASNSTGTFLRPSPSETSLTRSRSLNYPSKPKHSPDCKDNPYKL